jgi:DNA-binding response OmpR family regulator
MRLRTERLYEYGPFRLDPDERRLTREGIPLALAPKVFDLLVYLVQNGGRLLTKEKILNAALRLQHKGGVSDAVAVIPDHPSAVSWGNVSGSTNLDP